MLLASVFFAAGFVPLATSWFVYPAVVQARAATHPARYPVTGQPLPVPRIRVVCAARNAAADVQRRIIQLQALDYPAEALEIVIVDDGSTDETARLARETVVVGGHLVEVISVLEGGKARAINAGVAHAMGTGDPDIVVFCDVRQQIGPDALLGLVAPFADPRVVATSGVLLPAEGAGRPAALFRRFENALRLAESGAGSAIGATGAWHAVRARAFVPLPDRLILDDIWIPLQAVFQGGRAVVSPAATIHDVSRHAEATAASRVRSLGGMFQLIALWPELLSPVGNPVWARFICHRVLRLVTPFGLGLMGAGVVVGVMTPGPLWPLWAALATGGVASIAAVGAVAVVNPEVRQGLREMGAVLAPAQALMRFLRRDFTWT